MLIIVLNCFLKCLGESYRNSRFVMAVAELVGSLGGVSRTMSTSGGVLACACLMAMLRVVIVADRIAEFVAFYAMKLIQMVAWTLSVEPTASNVLVGKVGVIFHTLGTAFVLNVSAAMICAMARLLQAPKT